MDGGFPWSPYGVHVHVYSSQLIRFAKIRGLFKYECKWLHNFFTYMLQQNGENFYKGLYVTFKLAPDLKKYTVYLSIYSLLKEGDVDILTNSMLQTYTSDIDARIILR